MAKMKFEDDGKKGGSSTGSPSTGSGGAPLKVKKRTLAQVMNDQKLARLFGTMWATAMGEVLMGPEYGWSEEAAAALVKTVIAKANSYVKAKGGAGG